MNYGFTDAELEEIKPFLTPMQRHCLNEWNQLIAVDISDRIDMWMDLSTVEALTG